MWPIVSVNHIMPVSYDQRGWSSGSAHAGACLSDKYEVLKEIGDGSFGSVALARVRTGGAHIAKRNSMVSPDPPKVRPNVVT